MLYQCLVCPVSCWPHLGWHFRGAGGVNGADLSLSLCPSCKALPLCPVCRSNGGISFSWTSWWETVVFVSMDMDTLLSDLARLCSGIWGFSRSLISANAVLLIKSTNSSSWRFESWLFAALCAATGHHQDINMYFCYSLNLPVSQREMSWSIQHVKNTFQRVNKHGVCPHHDLYL